MHTAVYARFGNIDEATDVILNGECKIGIVEEANGQTCLVHVAHDFDLVMEYLSDVLFDVSVFLETSVIRDSVYMSVLRVDARIDEVSRAFTK